MTEKLLIGKDSLHAVDGKLVSERFKTMHENLCLKVRVNEGAPFSYTLVAFNSKGEREEIYSQSYGGESTEGVYRFDPISLAVYHDSQEFLVEICVEASTVLDFSVCEEYEDGVAAAEETPDVTHICEDGSRGIYVKRPDGVRELVPTVPKKGIIMGNSLVLGMFNAYGMCSSASDKDYFHYVTTEIKKYNPDFTCARVHGSGFEQSETDEAYSKWLYEDPNPGTGKPTYLSFEPDVDFIIIQLTDNVNTDEKVVKFNERLDTFLEMIKTMCPKARIIWVHGWYNYLRTADKLKESCEKYEIERINIRDLYTIKNQARDQKYATRPDGSVIEVPDRWISHPGDLGMKKIADRIISVIKLG